MPVGPFKVSCVEDLFRGNVVHAVGITGVVVAVSKHDTFDTFWG